jgi:hypothetical protein
MFCRESKQSRGLKRKNVVSDEKLPNPTFQHGILIDVSGTSTSGFFRLIISRQLKTPPRQVDGARKAEGNE